MRTGLPGSAARTLVCSWSATIMGYQGGEAWRMKLLEVDELVWEESVISAPGDGREQRPHHVGPVVRSLRLR